MIIGAANGIGRQVSEDLLKMGCFVYAADRDIETLKLTFGTYEKNNLLFLEMDVRESTSIQAAFNIINENERGLYGIVNSAGIFGLPNNPLNLIQSIVEMDPDTAVAPIIDVNLYGTMRVNNTFFPLIWKSKGVFINMSSTSAILTTPGIGAYSISKKAIFGYSDCMRRELTSYGIRVSCIEPGFIATPMTRFIFEPDPTEKFNYEKTFLKNGRGDEGMAIKVSGKWENLPKPSMVSDKIIYQLFHDPVCPHIIVDNPSLYLFYNLISYLPYRFVDWLLMKMRTKI